MRIRGRAIFSRAGSKGQAVQLTIAEAALQPIAAQGRSYTGRASPKAVRLLQERPR